MSRIIAIIILCLSLLAGVGESLGLLLPTLSWPFTAARELSFLSISAPADTWWSPDGQFLWFGWLCLLLSFSAGIWLLIQPKSRFTLTPMNARRIVRFKSIKRGYFSLIILGVIVLMTCLDQSLVGKRALLVIDNGSWYFPAFVRSSYPGKTFGQDGALSLAEANYRLLKRESQKTSKPQFVLMPPIPFDPSGDSTALSTEALEQRDDGCFYETGSSKPYSGQASRLFDEDFTKAHIRYRLRQGLPDGLCTGWQSDGNEVYSGHYNQGKLKDEQFSGSGSKEDFLTLTAPNKLHIIHYHPAPPLRSGHILGTNTQGSDILAYLFGGLQVNIKAALLYIPIVYFIGISLGMLMGYFGGKFDLGVQRLIEIFSQIPFLFLIMIISDLVPLQLKGLFLVLGLLSLFGWMSMTYLLRTSTMKEKERDYVAAAKVLGASTSRILFVHILPNLIAILITLIPFSISGLILSLASLDYLGFGLPDYYASWGRLLNDGLSNLAAPWVVSCAFMALVITLLLVTFIGEAIREAFDPKKFTTYK